MCERDSGSCFLSVGIVVRYTGTNHTFYFTMTVVASMSTYGLTLLTSVPTTAVQGLGSI